MEKAQTRCYQVTNRPILIVKKTKLTSLFLSFNFAEQKQKEPNTIMLLGNNAFQTTIQKAETHVVDTTTPRRSSSLRTFDCSINLNTSCHGHALLQELTGY